MADNNTNHHGPSTENLVSPQFTIRCAGLCEPINPGGYGCWAYLVLDQSGAEIFVDFQCLGYGPDQSAQVSAFAALIQGAKWAADHANGARVLVQTHTQTIVEQVNGVSACRVEHLKPLRAAASALRAASNIKLEWIPGAANEAAKQYAQLAYREALALRKEAA